MIIKLLTFGKLFNIGPRNILRVISFVGFRQMVKPAMLNVMLSMYIGRRHCHLLQMYSEAQASVHGASDKLGE